MNYPAKLIKVIDGDSLRLEVDLGFNLKGVFDIQLCGIDAPEVVGKQAREGRTAKKAVTEWLKSATAITVFPTGEQNGAGRWWAHVDFSPVPGQTLNLSNELVIEGLAKSRIES